MPLKPLQCAALLGCSLLLFFACNKEEAIKQKPLYIETYLEPGAPCDEKNFVQYDYDGKHYYFEEGVTGKLLQLDINNGSETWFDFYDSLNYAKPGGEMIARIRLAISRHFLEPAQYRFATEQLSGLQFNFVPIDTITYGISYLYRSNQYDRFRITNVQGNRICGEFRGTPFGFPGKQVSGTFSVAFKY